jgi:transcription elongation factor GreA
MTGATNLITAEGLASLNAELEELEGEGRREIAERIKTAREWGDLKENSEYHDAKNEQAHLETKIARVRDEHGAEHTWQIVSSHDAAPAEGRLSADSPVALALLGRGPGDSARVALPKGKRTFTVISVG